MHPDDRKLTALLAPLREAGDTLVSASADQIRTLGNRQARRQGVTVGLMAVTALIATVLVVLQLTGGGNPRPLVTDTAIPTNSPSTAPASPTTAVECSATLPGIPAGQGDSVPAGKMLSGADFGPAWQLTNDRAGYQPYLDCAPLSPMPMPDVCEDHQPYAADQFRTAGRWRTYRGEPSVGQMFTADELVTTFQPGQAAAFMAELRTRIAGCPDFVNHSSTPEARHAEIITQFFAGDDSLIAFLGRAPSDQAAPIGLWGVVRVGDQITVVSMHSEFLSDPTDLRIVAVKAANLLD